MRAKPTKKEFLKTRNIQPTEMNPYDLSQVGMGFNQPCPRCGLEIDRRTSPYEPIGFINYCRCKK